MKSLTFPLLAAVPKARATLAALAALLTWSALAAAPTIDRLLPAGAQRGVTTTIKAEGTFTPWPVQAWADSPTIHVTPAKDPGSLSIQIDKDCPAGPHVLRLYNAEGASSPELFMVSDVLEINEAEPNDDFRKPQRATTMPTIINGVLEKSGDVDCYAVHLDAGQRLVASLEGRRLGSPIDPMLHLLSSDGIELAFAHDGLGLDPLLTFVAPRSADYVIRVSAFANPPAADVRLTGGKDDLYRLHLTTGPAARFTIPAAVQRGTTASLQLLGCSLPENAQLTADATAASPDVATLRLATPSPDAYLRVALSTQPERLATDFLKSNTSLPLPLGLTGRLLASGEEHRFTFTAKKGEALRFVVRAPSIDSPLDPLLKIESADGKPLATANAAATSTWLSDPVLNWSAPADGTYHVALTDLYHKAGPDYVYHLVIVHPTPAAYATVAADAVTLSPGKSATVKLTVTRADGHAAPLIAVATQLPPGVTCTGADVPPKGGEVQLILSAAPDAKAASAPIRFMTLATDPIHPEAHTATFNLRTTATTGSKKDKSTPQELIDGTDSVWLTVLPPPATAPASQPTTKPK